MQLLGDVFSSLTAAVGAADKVVELMQQRPAIPPHGALQPADFAGRLELDSVTFSYPARPEAPVLNGLSLKVDPGEVNALDASVLHAHIPDIAGQVHKFVSVHALILTCTYPGWCIFSSFKSSIQQERDVVQHVH